MPLRIPVSTLLFLVAIAPETFYSVLGIHIILKASLQIRQLPTRIFLSVLCSWELIKSQARNELFKFV